MPRDPNFAESSNSIPKQHINDTYELSACSNLQRRRIDFGRACPTRRAGWARDRNRTTSLQNEHTRVSKNPCIRAAWWFVACRNIQGEAGLTSAFPQQARRRPNGKKKKNDAFLQRWEITPPCTAKYIFFSIVAYLASWVMSLYLKQWHNKKHTHKNTASWHFGVGSSFTRSRADVRLNKRRSILVTTKPDCLWRSKKQVWL